MFGVLPKSGPKQSAESLPVGPISWLLAYFACNLVLTIYNKLVLAGDFPFPYTLTAIHCLFATIGSWACLRSGGFSQARLSQRESIIIFLFSAIFTVNILVSNVSLYILLPPRFPRLSFAGEL